MFDYRGPLLKPRLHTLDYNVLDSCMKDTFIHLE